MPDLINILESFNRKERFFLVSQALGSPKFELATGFREKLAKSVDLEPGIEIPANAFAAMDYHLNWVHASLVLAHYGEVGEQGEITLSDEKGISLLHKEGAIKSNQQDVDLLVAFRSGENYHLIFVEAKGYDTDGLADFDGDNQLGAKAGRFKKIFDPDNTLYPNVTPYFCLMSGKEHTNVDWGKWLELNLPKERLVVKYNASVRKVRKGAKSEQIIPPKGKP